MMSSIALFMASLFLSQCLGEDEKNTWLDGGFRTRKINFIWDKAVSHLTDKAQIRRLKAELAKFDGLYLSAKSPSTKNENFATHEIDTKLESVLEKYGLESAVLAYNKKQKWKNEEEMKKVNSVLPSEKFIDSKLQKLWFAAQNSHFTEAELKALHKELKDHERNMDLYREKLSHFNAIHENTLHEDAFEEKEKLTQDLKEHNQALEMSYDKLHKKVSESRKRIFRNEKVDTLWRSAVQNPNFTSNELESIRTELEHFDKRLDKMKHHDEELKAVKKQHEELGKVNIYDDEIERFEEENKRLSRKLRKLENYLEKRIVHSEL